MLPGCTVEGDGQGEVRVRAAQVGSCGVVGVPTGVGLPDRGIAQGECVRGAHLALRTRGTLFGNAVQTAASRAVVVGGVADWWNQFV